MTHDAYESTWKCGELQLYPKYNEEGGGDGDNDGDGDRNGGEFFMAIGDGMGGVGGGCFAEDS